MFQLLFLILTLISGCHKAEMQDVLTEKAVYYLDSQNGNDHNKGHTPQTAWKTLERLEKTTLKPGEKVLLKRGCVFRGTLTIAAGGNSTSPIVVSAWPEDGTNLPRPVINAKSHLAAITLSNSSYVTISHIEMVSDGGDPVESRALKERYGILVGADGEYKSCDIRLQDLYIHDIFASKQVSAGGQNPTSNKGMGIFFESGERATFDSLLIEKCRIENTGHTGIKIRANTEDTTFYDRKVRILGNSLKNIGGPGIQPGKCLHILVRGNMVDHSGATTDPRMHGRGSGIWLWYCHDVLIEYNRFLFAHGKMDSHGAHIDHHCRDVVIQYNMSIENGGGFVEILGANHNCSYRYNISVNDGWRVKGKDGAMQNGEILFISNYTGKNVKKEGPYDCYIYNNTIFVKKGQTSGFFLSPTTSGLLVANNIFYLQGQTQTTVRKGNDVPGTVPRNVFFTHNLYLHGHGLPQDFPAKDTLPFWGDPEFALPGGISPEDYIPANTNLIKNKGIVIEKLPDDPIGLQIGLLVDKDILGNAIIGKPNLGAIEVP